MLDVANGTVSQVGDLPWAWMSLNIKSVQTQNSTNIYIIYGDIETYTLFRFDTETHVLENVREMGETLEVYVAGATLNQADNTLRMFGCINVEPNSCDLIIETDLESGQFTMRRTGFPWSFMNTQIPSDGEIDYLFNIYDFHQEGMRGLFAYNGTSQESMFLTIQDFPGPALTGTSAVYVKELNRLYTFGGQTHDIGNGTTTFLDEIWWVDLDS